MANRPGPLVRWLDGWMAKLIHFPHQDVSDNIMGLARYDIKQSLSSNLLIAYPENTKGPLTEPHQVYITMDAELDYLFSVNEVCLLRLHVTLLKGSPCWLKI